MTTIRDMLIRDLRAIGAEGVACGSFEWTIEDLGSLPEPPVDRLSGPAKEAALIFARPAFRDDEGRLVPLPDGWEVEATGALRGPLIRGMGYPMITRRRDGSFSLRGTSRTKSYAYPTAPEAWAAAEAWLKEQGR